MANYKWRTWDVPPPERKKAPPAPFKENEMIVNIGSEKTLMHHGGNRGRLTLVFGKVYSVRSCTSRALRIYNDPIGYCFHPGDWRAATAKEIRIGKATIPKRIGGAPMWVHNLKDGHWSQKRVSTNVDYAIYEPAVWKTETPSFRDLHDNVGRLAVKTYRLAPCFGSMTRATWQSNPVMKMKSGGIWMCTHLVWGGYAQTRKRMIVRYIRLLIRNGCLPKRTKYSVDKERYTVWFPISNHSNRWVYQACCFLRNPSEHSYIVPSTLNLVDRHGMDFLISYVSAHYIPNVAMSSHTMFDSAETSYGKTATNELPPLIVRRAMQIRKYIDNRAPKEETIKEMLDRGARNPGSFRLSNYVNKLAVDVPPDVDWKTLKTLKL